MLIIDMGQQKDFEENLSQCHFVLRKSIMDSSGTEPGPVWWEADRSHLEFIISLSSKCLLFLEKKTCYVPPMVFVQVQSCLIVRGIVLSWRNGDHVRFEQAPCLLLHIFLWIIKTGTRKTVFMPNTWWTFSEKWVREYSNLVVAPPVPLLNPFPTLEDLVRSKIF